MPDFFLVFLRAMGADLTASGVGHALAGRVGSGTSAVVPADDASSRSHVEAPKQTPGPL
jgi:hypothetical protein